ncbi:hypothetical protein [Xanthobacter aminoxidans]|uniref:hypothetical protein n=1 Tax=Xanthobacter aminoxidans TaxID=186280 RepID=UPI002022D5AE|nr:hypothetical protein [Xanthobacter aminoxidans]MCL8382113.1 hypothetical protein [Xanthobacter aminoxidans]
MAEIVALNPEPTWLFSVHVSRRPDGTLVASLSDARASLIGGPEETPREKLLRFSDLLAQSVSGMREEARKIGEEPRHG